MRTYDLTKKKTMRKTKTIRKKNTFKEHLQRAILVTCDIWDTDYIPDNWEPEFMTTFVTWQLRVTRDSIRNFCDVLICSCPVQIYNGGKRIQIFAHTGGTDRDVPRGLRWPKNLLFLLFIITISLISGQDWGLLWCPTGRHISTSFLQVCTTTLLSYVYSSLGGEIHKYQR